MLEKGKRLLTKLLLLNTFMIVAASYSPSAPPFTPYCAPYMCTLRCDCRPNPTQHCPFIHWDPLLQLKKEQVERLHLPSRTSTRLDPLRADTASAEAFPSKYLPLLPTDKIRYSLLSPPFLLSAGCLSMAAKTPVHRTSSSCPRR